MRSIVVAAPPGHVHDLAGADLGVVAGGATRAESVANALAAVGTELVAIHDAARPLVTPELLEDLVADLVANPEAAGAIAAAPVTDTIKRAAPPKINAPAPRSGSDALRCSFPADAAAKQQRNVVAATEDRALLWAAQTPQLFRVEALRAALRVDAASRDAATDESMLVEAAGGTVLIHPSGPENLKVTTPYDLRVAELLLRGRG